MPQLHDFFRTAFAYVHQHLKGQASLDEVLRAARLVLDEMATNVAPAAWDNAERSRIQELKQKTALGRPVRIVAFVTEASDTQLIRVQEEDGETEDVETTRVRLQDRHGDDISSMDVIGLDLVRRLQQAAKTGEPLELLGASVALPVAIGPDLEAERREFLFQVIDVASSYSILDLIGASDDERSMATELLRDMEAAGIRPVDRLRDDLISQLKIVGTGEFPLLKDLIEFVVFQALSCGSITHASARLHGLIVGPPGQGKKLIGLAARVLNPTYAELSASKSSAAGLVGASVLKSGMWRSQPGALARAAHGVAILQDAHAWNAGELGKVSPILLEVIEDGVVRDATAGGRTRAAPVALLIDLNRAGQLGAGSSTEVPILRLRPLLSRVDLIAEIPPDADRAWRVGMEMYSTLRAGEALPFELQLWAREVQVLVATLRDTIPKVDLSGVREHMAQVHQQIWEANKNGFESFPEAGDVPARMAITFGRLVMALARGAMRAQAIPDDVVRATRFLNMKLDFLRLHGAAAVAEDRGPGGRQDRSAWVRDHAAVAVSPEALAESYERETGNAVSVKTIRRDLTALGAKKAARGMYYLPALPPADGTSGHRDIGTSDLVAPGSPDPMSVDVPALKYPVAEAEGFKKKELADCKLDLLGLCGFGCLYCSSNWGNYLRIRREKFAAMTEAQLGTRHYPDQKPGLTFRWPKILPAIESQLAEMGVGFGEGKTLVFSMLTDAFSPMLLAEGLTRAALELLLKRTSFRIRVLTKNAVVGLPEWIDFFSEHPGRFVVGLSTGTLDDSWSRSAEIGTSPPTARLRALKNLQDADVPTFGMLCPVFPDMLDGNRLDELVDAISPNAVEHVWAEPYNERTNWEAVRDTFGTGSSQYKWFNAAFGEDADPAVWSNYAARLYLRLRSKAEVEGWLPKLRYLLYEDRIAEADATAFSGLRNAGVLLQSKPCKDGRSQNPHIAELQTAAGFGR